MTARAYSAPPASQVTRDRTALAFWLDALLLALFLLIQSPRITGVAAHEWIGIAIAVPLLVHVLLSWHWIVSKPARLLANGSWRSRINYLINVTLFVAMVIAIVSGVVVSRVALPQLGIHTIYDGDWFETHDFWSNVLFVRITASTHPQFIARCRPMHTKSTLLQKSCVSNQSPS